MFFVNNSRVAFLVFSITQSALTFAGEIHKCQLQCVRDHMTIWGDPLLMIYFSLLHGATCPALSGLSLPAPDPAPCPARRHSDLSAPTHQSRPSTSVYSVYPSSHGHQTQISCREHVAANCHQPCPRVRVSPVAGLRWHPPLRHQRPPHRLLARSVTHPCVLFTDIELVRR